MIRQTLFLTVLAVLTLMVSVAYSDTSSEMNKKTAIYGSEIDQKIAFYQSRLYLLDSEYTILSEIGRDASAKTTYLIQNRGKIIKDMIAANAPLNCCKIKAFIGNCLCKNVVASAL
jgi:exopolysaccharide biosynthesis protein